MCIHVQVQVHSNVQLFKILAFNKTAFDCTFGPLLPWGREENKMIKAIIQLISDTIQWYRTGNFSRATHDFIFTRKPLYKVKFGLWNGICSSLINSKNLVVMSYAPGVSHCALLTYARKKGWITYPRMIAPTRMVRNMLPNTAKTMSPASSP